MFGDQLQKLCAKLMRMPQTPSVSVSPPMVMGPSSLKMSSSSATLAKDMTDLDLNLAMLDSELERYRPSNSSLSESAKLLLLPPSEFGTDNWLGALFERLCRHLRALDKSPSGLSN